MTVNFGVDFHDRQQTISYCELAEGEIHRLELQHQQRRAFYAGLTGQVIVGSNPVVTAPGSNSCWPSWDIHFG